MVLCTLYLLWDSAFSYGRTSVAQDTSTVTTSFRQILYSVPDTLYLVLCTKLHPTSSVHLSILYLPVTYTVLDSWLLVRGRSEPRPTAPPLHSPSSLQTDTVSVHRTLPTQSKLNPSPLPSLLVFNSSIFPFRRFPLHTQLPRSLIILSPPLDSSHSLRKTVTLI